MQICETCQCEHNGTYGSGRFCSAKCARGFSGSKSKGSIKKRKSVKWLCKECGKKLRRQNKYMMCNSCTRKSPEYIKKLKTSIAGKVGGYREGSGIGKKTQYLSPIAGLVKLDSMFEYEFAKKLDSENIQWIRNTKRFYFNWLGKYTYYIPDFYLIDYDLYIETKGYWYKDKFEKTKEAIKVNNIKVKIILQKEWDSSAPII